MPLIESHEWLVERIQGHWLHKDNELFGLRKDGAIETGNCPKIGTYRPDLFARVVPAYTPWIGEAKTLRDIRGDHTGEQLIAYLEFIRNEGAGHLFIAVPWVKLDEMCFEVRRAKRIAAAAAGHVTMLGCAYPQAAPVSVVNE